MAAPTHVSCRDFSRVQRRCEMEKDSRHSGRDILACSELRETFRLCNDREPEKLSTTVIETREPLLGGHTLLATSRWELGMPAPDPRELHAAAAASTSSSSHPHPTPGSDPHDRPLPSHPLPPPSSSGRAFSPGRPSSARRSGSPGRTGSPGRSYRPWNVLADDGGGGGAGGGGGYNPEAMLTPRVGQAVQDILQFADEMQQDLAQHGMKLARQGEQRRRPGFLARLFGARTDEPEPMPEPGGGRIEPH